MNLPFPLWGERKQACNAELLLKKKKKKTGKELYKKPHIPYFTIKLPPKNWLRQYINKL